MCVSVYFLRLDSIRKQTLQAKSVISSVLPCHYFQPVCTDEMIGVLDHDLHCNAILGRGQYGLMRRNEWRLSPRFCTVMLYWARVMNHAPGAGSIARHQSVQNAEFFLMFNVPEVQIKLYVHS